MDPLKILAPRVMTWALVVLAACVMVTLLRTFIGPRMSDRMIGVNMIGTQSICLIVCLVLRLREDWLVDIAIIYAMFSFLSVTVLTKMDIGVHRQWRDAQRRNRENRLEHSWHGDHEEHSRRRSRRDRS